jgi:hypothetical protein
MKVKKFALKHSFKFLTNGMKTLSLKASLPVILPAYKGFKNDKF